MSRPWRITVTVVVDREAFNEEGARHQSIAVVSEIRRNVGGSIQSLLVDSIEVAERRRGGDRRQGEPERPGMVQAVEGVWVPSFRIAEPS